MECPICWDEFESSAFSLNCGHLFHRECLQPLANAQRSSIVCPLCRRKGSSTFQTSSIREVFFTCVTSVPNSSSSGVNPAGSEPLDEAGKEDIVATLARIRAQNKCLRADNLKGQQQLEAAMEREALLLQEVEGTTNAALVAERQLSEIRAARDGWKRRAKKLEQETVKQQCELDEMDEIKRQCDALKKTIRQMAKEAEALKTSKTQPPIPPTKLRGRLEPMNLSENISHSKPSELSDSESGSYIHIVRRNLKATRPPVSLVSITARHQRSEPNPRPIKLLPKVTPVPKTQTKVRKLQTGNAILWRGYGCPRKTPVLECTAADGYHHFSGKGTNQYKKRYTCTICQVVISEKA